MHPLEQLRDDALREIEAARDEKSLEGVRVKYLGKSGSISEWGERMKTLGKEERPSSVSCSTRRATPLRSA
jgi:Phenylalanyl-tRNA synthetase alpha subunit